jgi:hypothetical protein
MNSILFLFIQLILQKLQCFRCYIVSERGYYCRVLSGVSARFKDLR